MTTFTYSCFDELVYSAPLPGEVTLDEALDEVTLPAGIALWLFFDGLLLGSLFAWPCPSSASFLIRFMIVGTNLLDKEMIPGSWKKKKTLGY